MSAASREGRHTVILKDASECIQGFVGTTLDALEIAKPVDLEYAILLGKVVSKLSPMLGNIIEYRAAAELNEKCPSEGGKWVRQDPGFPDTIFRGDVVPVPGIEIKTWFALATEITARFKDSITHFRQGNTLVAMLAWVPEHIIYGKPCLIDVWVAPARTVAKARDNHYHKPPHYLVFEPEDTRSRTINLRQTNTNGYKFQGTPKQLTEADRIVASWGDNGRQYDPSPEYQAKLRALQGAFTYRLDTNFAKMDRIDHKSLEKFKKRVLGKRVNGLTIKEWVQVLKEPESDAGRAALAQVL